MIVVVVVLRGQREGTEGPEVWVTAGSERALWSRLSILKISGY